MNLTKTRLAYAKVMVRLIMTHNLAVPLAPAVAEKNNALKTKALTGKPLANVAAQNTSKTVRRLAYITIAKIAHVPLLALGILINLEMASAVFAIMVMN